MVFQACHQGMGHILRYIPGYLWYKTTMLSSLTATQIKPQLFFVHVYSHLLHKTTCIETALGSDTVGQLLQCNIANLLYMYMYSSWYDMLTVSYMYTNNIQKELNLSLFCLAADHSKAHPAFCERHWYFCHIVPQLEVHSHCNTDPVDVNWTLTLKKNPWCHFGCSVYKW